MGETTQRVATNSNKRKFEAGTEIDLRNNSYFKIRALVSQLRPYFIQVLQTPYFRGCEVADEIRNKMTLVVDLYKQMISDAEPSKRVALERQPFSAENVLQRQDGYFNEPIKPQEPYEKSEENKAPATLNANIGLGDAVTRKSYVIGGSPFGWNFITYAGSAPAYYGETKESQRNTRKRTNADNDHSPSTEVAKPKKLKD